MVEKRDYDSRSPGRPNQQQNYGNKQQKTYARQNPSRPRDIFDVYNSGFQQNDKKHQESSRSKDIKAPETKSTAATTLLDRVALFTQLSFELEHDLSFAKEFSKIAGDEAGNRALELARSVNSNKIILSNISKAGPKVPHSSIPSRPCPTLEAWFDHYPDHLPALPPILDTSIEEKVFTAPGSIASGNNTHGSSYERLEWLGDAYIELMTRRIIFNIFLDTSEALPATITQDFVRNENLARFALAYGFDERLKLAPKHMANTHGSAHKTMIKMYGDVFEAYVAAVVESDPDSGYQTVYQWLSALIKPTILKYKNVVPVNTKAKEELARKVMGKGIKLTWTETQKPEPVKGGTIYSYSVAITGWGYHEESLGSGQGLSKSQAQMLAAMEAVINPTTAIICAIKTEYDNLVRIEREKENGPDPEIIAALDERYKKIPVT